MMQFETLEREFANYIGTNGCVTVNTGTAALHVALEALNLPSNSEVIVPQYTMIATAWAVHYARLNPVFIDCDDSLLINIDKIERSINPKTRVIMLTHVYGRVVNMDEVMDLAKRYELRVIEDAAEAHGCEWRGKRVGSFDIGCFSFYRNKIVCGEEGGAVTSNDLEFLDTVRDMKCMSFGKHHNYNHNRIGFNYRMTNSQAELILESLSNVDNNIKLRRENAKLYDSLIDKKYHMPERDVPWVYDIKVNDNIIVDRLRKKNIQARYGFKPCSINAPFNRWTNISNSFELSKRIMYLPVTDSESEIIYNVKELNKCLK